MHRNDRGTLGKSLVIRERSLRYLDTCSIIALEATKICFLEPKQKIVCNFETINFSTHVYQDFLFHAFRRAFILYIEERPTISLSLFLVGQMINNDDTGKMFLIEQIDQRSIDDNFASKFLSARCKFGNDGRVYLAAATFTRRVATRDARISRELFNVTAKINYRRNNGYRSFNDVVITRWLLAVLRKHVTGHVCDRLIFRRFVLATR